MDKGFSKRENPEMKRRRYTSEFKREAARMLIIEGLNVREVSKQLGVAENILYRWKQEHINELEANKPTGGQSEVQRIIGPVSFQFS
jgi:transposase-like protein